MLLFGLAVLMMIQEPLRVEVALVTVGVRVTDRGGRAIGGLKAGDFVLYENGVRQEIAFFSSEELPISLGILLDRSDSMAASGKLQRAKDTARYLVNSSHQGTEFLYLAFDWEIPMQSAFISDPGLVETEIENTRMGGGTRLYDAIIEGLRMCRNARHPRQALVIITDGADQHSSRSLNDMIREVQESQAQIYAIGYFGPDEDRLFRSAEDHVTRIDGREIDNPRVVFQRLATESGAEAFFPRSDPELRKAIEWISTDLRQQYTLSFYPPKGAGPGEYRRIQVKVKHPGARVRARPGYALGK